MEINVIFGGFIFISCVIYAISGVQITAVDCFMKRKCHINTKSGVGAVIS